ncbi:MAG: hypothetical protein AB1758_00950 [Candidatus Eremiobacterota bacterium]
MSRLFDQGLDGEARQAADRVQGFPALSACAQRAALRLKARPDWPSILQELCSPDLDPSRSYALHGVIHSDLVDLGLLERLPADHELRDQGAVLREAFHATPRAACSARVSSCPAFASRTGSSPGTW